MKSSREKSVVKLRPKVKLTQKTKKGKISEYYLKLSQKRRERKTTKKV